MRRLIYRRDGELVKDKVWRFYFGRFAIDLKKFDMTVRGELVSSCDHFIDCSRNPKHTKSFEATEIVVELLGAGVLGNFLSVWNSGLTLTTQTFVDLATKAGLSGFKAERISVEVNQSDRPKLSDEVLNFKVTGAAGVDCRWVLPDGGSVCRFCHEIEIVCKECGDLNDPCPKCGRENFTFDKGKATDDLAYFDCSEQEDPRIVSKKDWDGSDFFELRGPMWDIFISDRAKRFLEALPVHDFEIYPALLETTTDPRTDPKGPIQDTKS